MSYGGAFFIGIFAFGFVMLVIIICSLISKSNEEDNSRTSKHNYMLEKFENQRDMEDEEADFEMLWSEGGDMDDSF
jgi:hypothetical protein